MKVLTSVLLLSALYGCGGDQRSCLVTGSNCPEAVKGDKGDTGEQGETGKTGATGKQGAMGAQGYPGRNGTSCSVRQISSGARIMCTDGSFAYILNGSNGRNGIDGEDGKAGSSCTVSSTDNGAEITCEDGTTAEVLNGQAGTNGTNGVNGTNGTNGSDGASCSVSAVSNGASVTCGNTTAVVYNGTVYPDIQYILPCASNPMNPTSAELSNINLEVFLKLPDGKILTSVSDTTSGNNTRFGILVNGNFRSTGHTSCTFNVNNGVVTRTGN